LPLAAAHRAYVQDVFQDNDLARKALFRLDGFAQGPRGFVAYHQMKNHGRESRGQAARLPSQRASMHPAFTTIPHRAAGRFPPLAVAYAEGDARLQPFLEHLPTDAGAAAAIAARAALPTNRAALVEVLQEQYRGLRMHDAVAYNIAALADEQTFTVCTAHQPNLLTGYLYFVYKILHAVKLAAHLAGLHPDKRFVPVFYVGSEDADLDELGTFWYAGKRYTWDGAGQGGAVGRMRPEGLEPLLDGLFRELGPPGAHTDRLKTILREAYIEQSTIAAATRYLVNELLGSFGVVVLDADDARLKQQMLSVFRDDLLNGTAERLMREAESNLATAGFSAQAHPRPVNLFYLTEGRRDRIERVGEDAWQVVDTAVSFSRQSLEAELAAHPDRFSPNVVLRPLLQEKILPNVAFIGGSAEVAYWLQLRPVFRHYGVSFPVVVARQSVQWVDAVAARAQQALELSDHQLFLPREAAVDAVLASRSKSDWQTLAHQEALQSLSIALEAQAAGIDSTLKAAAGAASRRMARELERLEEKMRRARKRQEGEELQRLDALQECLFPGGGLQERRENFVGYYAQYGPEFFDAILEGTDPWGSHLLLGRLPG